jgi:cyclopropane fatty-acyl-phospholipid synthase-like methyltransferase
MNPNQTLWEKGDFTRIAATMRESGETVVESLGITPGLKVLDLGCGDGTTALPAARRGADVLGIDIARNLVEAGNKRAQAEGLNLRHVSMTHYRQLSGRAPCGELRQLLDAGRIKPHSLNRGRPSR